MFLKRNDLAGEAIIQCLLRAKVGVVVQGLTDIDVDEVLAFICEKLDRHVMAAVVGYQAKLKRRNLTLAKSIEPAVAWRSNQEYARRIVVFVRNEIPKLHSLDDLSKVTSRDLSHCLLQQCIDNPEINEPEKRFWVALYKQSASISLGMLIDFVENAKKTKFATNAISSNLWRLGLLPDAAVLERVPGPAARLRRNRDLLLEMSQLSEASRRRMSSVLTKASGAQQDKLREAFRALTDFFRRGKRETLQSLDFEIVDSLISAGRPITSERGPKSDGNGPAAKPLRGRELTAFIADLVVSSSDESREGLRELARLAKSRLADEAPTNEPVLGETITDRPIEVKYGDQDVRRLMGGFCSETHWGGVLISSKEDVRTIIRLQEKEVGRRSAYDPTDPSQGVASRPLFDLIRQCDRHLSGRPLGEALDRLISARCALIPHLDLLLADPLLLFSGFDDARQALNDYISAYSDLLHRFRRSDPQLYERDQSAARLISMELLRLDVIHFKTPTEWKAMITPLHPFHLWRFREILNYIERSGRALDEQGRRQLSKTLVHLPQLLHFLILSQEVTKGEKIVELPQSDVIDLLPVFENRTNRYLGADGIESLSTLVSKWIDFAPYSRMQVRIALIDVPDVKQALSALTETLIEQEGLRIVVDAYFTRGQNPAGDLVRIDYEDADHEIAEMLQEERLILRIYRNDSVAEAVEIIQRSPVHLAAFFDQTQYHLEHGSKARNLIVSPLVVTYDYDYSEAIGRGSISPSSEAEEGLFADYHFLVGRVAHMAPGQQVRLQFATDINLGPINSLLGTEGAKWLAIADRSLTPYAPAAAIQLGEIGSGRRQVGIWAGSSSRMVERLTRLLRKYNLHPDLTRVAQLMEQFGHIASGGVLNLPSLGGNAEARETNEKGLIGTLLAAAWYAEEYPDSLIASLDSTEARQWLQGRSDGKERADLIGLRESAEGSLIVEPIEVKTRDFDETRKERSSRDGGYQLSGKAVEQLDSMLRVLPAVFGGSDLDPLFTPARREALKLQVHQECFRELHAPDWRTRWYSILKKAFRQPPDVTIDLCGLIVHVDLDFQGDIAETTDSVNPVRLVRLGAARIQRLLSDLDDGTSTSSTLDKEALAEQRDDYDPEPASEAPPEVAVKVSVDEEDEQMQLARDFVRAAESYRVRVESCNPERAVKGPTVWRFYVKLARGQRLDPLRNVLEDVGREIRRSGLLISPLPDSDEIALDVPRRARDFLPLDRGLAALPAISSPESMPLAIGVTPEGQDIVRDLGEMHHMLVGGTTGSGKTVFLYSILVSLLVKHPQPDSLRILLCTSKPEDFTFFRGLPHLETGDVIDEAERAIDLFETYIPALFNERLDILTRRKCRDIKEYNALKGQPLPPLVVVVDEFADLADQLSGNKAKRDQFYTHLRRVAQLGRSRGIHLVLCTQRPSADLVPTNIRNLMNARAALRVNDGTASRMILDEAGAEQLQMHGDLLFKYQGLPLRVQSYWIGTDQLIQILNRFRSRGEKG